MFRQVKRVRREAVANASNGNVVYAGWHWTYSWGRGNRWILDGYLVCEGGDVNRPICFVTNDFEADRKDGVASPLTYARRIAKDSSSPDSWIGRLGNLVDLRGKIGTDRFPPELFGMYFLDVNDNPQKPTDGWYEAIPFTLNPSEKDAYAARYRKMRHPFAATVEASK